MKLFQRHQRPGRDAIWFGSAGGTTDYILSYANQMLADTKTL